MQPYGRLELANDDTVSLRAVPFTVGADRGVEDHLKYVAFSTKKFPVPDVGSVRVDAVINVKTPGRTVIAKCTLLYHSVPIQNYARLGHPSI